jgi:cell filamentation protein
MSSEVDELSALGAVPFGKGDVDPNDHSDDPYLDQKTGVLVNRFELTSQAALDAADYHSSAARKPFASFKMKRWKSPLDLSAWKEIHRTLFSELYEWAGSTRTVNSSKGGKYFMPFDEIEDEAAVIFGDRAGNDWLKGRKTPREFAADFAFPFGEGNGLHPFREGNGRTQRILFDEISGRAGWSIDWSKVDRSGFIAAMIQTGRGRLAPLSSIVEPIARRIDGNLRRRDDKGNQPKELPTQRE